MSSQNLGFVEKENFLDPELSIWRHLLFVFMNQLLKTHFRLFFSYQSGTLFQNFTLLLKAELWAHTFAAAQDNQNLSQDCNKCTKANSFSKICVSIGLGLFYIPFPALVSVMGSPMPTGGLSHTVFQLT